MKYPYAKVIHEEVVDGGWNMLIADMLAFSLKTFIFVFIGYFAFLCVGFSFGKVMIKELPAICEKM